MDLQFGRRRPLFKGRVLSLVNQDVRLPNGRTTTFHVVEHPGAVAVVPIFDNGDVMLIRQVRPATGGWLLEIVAGTREPGEAPRVTAGRELAEEIGHRARRLVKLGAFYTAPGFCSEIIHLYAAVGLRPGSAEKDPDEVIRPVRLPYRRALAMAESGRIKDAKTIAGLLLARRHAGVAR